MSAVSLTLPAALQLVVACCRPDAGAGRDASVRSLVESPAFDPGLLLDTVARHRVAPQVRDALRKAAVALPRPAADRLAEMADHAARRSLVLARESLALQAAFDADGLEAIFLKGTALSALLHADIGLKQSWDIDLLVPPEQVDAACSLLGVLGYELISPSGLSAEAFSRFQAVAKECVFLHRERQIYVELHWQLVDNPHDLGGLDRRRTQSVALAGGHLQTLADPELFAYLTVHGTRHGWSRLKWIVDVAAFLEGRSPEDIGRLRAEAVAMGAGRGPDVALHLCQALFGGPAGAGRLDAAGRHLVRTAYVSLTWGGGRREIAAYSRPWRMNWLGRHLIGRSPGAFLAELNQNLLGDHDRVHIVLPRGLGFLYYVIRLPLWLWRKMGPRRRSRPE